MKLNVFEYLIKCHNYENKAENVDFKIVQIIINYIEQTPFAQFEKINKHNFMNKTGEKIEPNAKRDLIKRKI